MQALQPRRGQFDFRGRRRARALRPPQPQDRPRPRAHLGPVATALAHRPRRHRQARPAAAADQPAAPAGPLGKLARRHDDAADRLAPRRAAGGHEDHIRTVMRHFARRRPRVGRRQRADGRRRLARPDASGSASSAPTTSSRRCAPRTPPTRARSSSSTTSPSRGRAASSTGSSRSRATSRPAACRWTASACRRTRTSSATTTRRTIAHTMRRFTDLGLEVQITEMDVGTSLLDVARPERLQRQALAYGAAARACNAVPACTRFTTWGFTDAVSWLAAAESAAAVRRQVPAPSRRTAPCAPRSPRA